MKNIYPILLLALGCGQKPEGPFGADVRQEPTAPLQAELLPPIGPIGMVVAIAFPQVAKSRKQAVSRVCQINLRTLEAVTEVWRGETFKSDEDVPAIDELKPYLRDQRLPICPRGGVYLIDEQLNAVRCTEHGVNTVTEHEDR